MYSLQPCQLLHQYQENIPGCSGEVMMGNEALAQGLCTEDSGICTMLQNWDCAYAKM